jgi:hypothetical protein
MSVSLLETDTNDDFDEEIIMQTNVEQLEQAVHEQETQLEQAEQLLAERDHQQELQKVFFD